MPLNPFGTIKLLILPADLDHMEFWIKAAQLLLSLSILVILHELGHFIPAKLFKTRVEKFYLFFDPKFSLFKFKKGETEYGIGWLPLGGYVKIAGMIDESMDKEAMAKPPQPWEFRSKPTWQRLIIMIGGVTVNLILGFLIFSAVLFVWGKTWVPAESTTWGTSFAAPLHDLGFEDGDKILQLDGVDVESVADAKRKMFLGDPKEITLERNDSPITMALPSDFGQLMIDSGLKAPFEMRIPTVIDTLIEGLPAISAGFMKGDSLIGVNDIESIFFNDISQAIFANKGQEVAVHLIRDGQKMTINCEVSEEGIGFGPINELDYWFETEHISYGFFESFSAGYNYAKEELLGYVISMKFIFSKAGASQIGGFGAIGGLFDADWDWHVFWTRTAWLSLVLAFMNILPIPALDGGHVMFLLYEMIAGKAPNQKFLEYAQLVGIILLLGLLLFANGNDIYRLFTGG